MEENAERRPLLSSHSIQGNGEADRTSETHVEATALQRQFTNVAICAALMLVFSLGSAIQVTPMSQLLEDILCRQIPQNGASSVIAVVGDACKEPRVQSELSKIQGWMNTLDIIPGILVAAPYGALADRHGYRAVLATASFGILIQNACQIAIYSYPSVFPIRLLWSTAVITLIGGGTAVLIPVLFAIVTAAVSEAQRSTAFFYLGAATQVGSLLSSPVAYLCMKANIWLPVYIGFGCLGIASGICLAVPVAQRDIKMQNAADSIDLREEAAHEEQTTLHRWIYQAADQADAMLHWAADHKYVTLFLITLLLTTLGKYASALEMQYITHRYKWSWSEAGLVLTARSLASLLLFTTVLPAAGNLLLLKGFTSISKDLFLARASLLLMVAGSVGVGLAPTRPTVIAGIICLASGSGYLYLARSIMGSMVSPAHTGLLYTIIAIFEALGTLVAGPLLSGLLNVGLGWGGRWVGLPFLVAGLMYTASWLIIWPVGAPLGTSQPDDEDVVGAAE